MRNIERVEHATHGPGSVIRILDGGRRVMVRFDGRPRTPYTLCTSELLAIEGMKPRPFLRHLPSRRHVLAFDPPKPQSAPELSPEALNVEGDELLATVNEVPIGIDETLVEVGESSEMSIEEPAARQALEALRLGVVPREHLEAITLGRDEELARVQDLLDQGSGMCMMRGPYGTGKTHLLDLVESKALGEGYLVARVTFDGNEVPPSHPIRIYGALMRSLSYPDEVGTGLRPLLERLGPSSEHIQGAGYQRWLSPALYAVHNCDWEFSETMIDFVSGLVADDHESLFRQLRRWGYPCEEGMLALSDYRTFGQIMANMLGAVAVWARDAGYKGLVLLMDEAEYLDRLNRVSKEMAENVIKYLVMATMDESEYLFASEEVYRGGHPVHRAIPVRYSDEQNLVVCSAFTPNPELDAVLESLFVDDSTSMNLESLQPADYRELASRITELVALVYPSFRPLEEHRQRIQEALMDAYECGLIHSTRDAARMVVAFWDLYRWGGADVALEALDS
jgi:hypothetical protein